LFYVWGTLCATKVRIYPTPEQAEFLGRQFGAVRFVYKQGVGGEEAPL
jgi:putative transposase